jgi:Na+/H+ antiporter NhaC
MTEAITANWYSLLPPLVAITLSFATRQVILALFAGVLTGGLVLFIQTGDLLQSSIIENFLLPALGSNAFAIILLVYLWSLGGIIGMWEKTGGAQYFAKTLAGVAKTPRASLVFAWIVGMVFHQGGTVSTVLAGTTVKPVTDQHRISHEELAYVVDSTASPVATLIPLNAWPIYIGGLVANKIPIITGTASAYSFFISCIPFNFYAIVTVTCTLLFALGWLPWIGKRMRAAQARARTTGQLDSDTAQPLMIPDESDEAHNSDYQPSFYDFILPIGIMLTMTILPFVLWKFGKINQENANWINAAFLSAAISAMLVAFIRGMPLSDILDGFSRGCKSMTLGAMIIGLAIALGIVAQRVGTATYLMQLTSGHIHPFALPAILTVLCMVVAFATGTAFGTYAVVFPIAIPLAYSLNPDPFFVKVCFGAVLGGTVFGDQCSPISDTTILSSMFTGCDLMDHVRTQLPLALFSAVLATILSTAILFLH